MILPTLVEVRGWLQVPASAVSDPQLELILEAEVAVQVRSCRVDPDPLVPQSHLVLALYRRIGRVVAARGVPLGMIGADSEFGAARLSRWDAEIERLEGPDRRLVFG